MREERDLPNDIPDDKKSPDTKTSDSGILRSEIRGRTELATCPSSSKFPSEFGSALERVIETGGRFKRLWLIRHFDYEDSPEANAYRKASERDKSLMSQSEIDSLNEIGKNVRANVDDPQIQRALRAAFRKRPDGTKMVLFSDFDESIMVRNRMTMEWVERDPSTRGSFVSERTKLSVPKTSDSGKKTYDAFTQTKTVIGTWEKSADDGTMLGNRTFAHPFGLRIGRPCDTEKDATARLERDGYDFWDVEKGESAKPVIPDGKTLRITPDNAPWLWKILTDACTDGELKLRIFQAFDELPLVMLQEAANDALSKLRTTDQAAFSTALRALCAWKDEKGNPDAELQSYAFERFVELGTPWNELLEIEWSSGALEWMATKRHREFVIRYYWASEKGPVDNVGPFAKSMNVKGMKSLFDEAYEYWKICEIQRNWSLDKLVQNGDGSAFVKRMTCIGGSHSGSPYISEEDILNFKRHRKYLLRSSVGTGKSIWLSELAKLTLLRGNSVRFYEAKTLKAEMFEPGGEIAKQYAEYPETVFCFDGIDEIPEESEFRIEGIDEIPEESERRKVKRLIAEFRWKCLVTSRNGEYEKKAEGFGTLRFVDFDSKTFLNSRITDVGIRKRVFDFLEKEDVGRDLEDNPLLLTLIALLANGNQSFESVRTKSDLYEKAVTFVLASHSKGKKGQSLRAVRLELSDWLKKLSEYAYALFCGKWEGSTNAYFESNLSILHKNGSGGNYEFVHKSFYEYFLATYFANLPGWNERVLYKVSSAFGTGRDWNEFGPVVFFYAEMLERKGDFMKLAEFLKRLPEGDDMYGTGFFLALDVIHKLSEKNGNAPEIENIRDGLVERASSWGTENILAGFDQIFWHWSALGKNRTLFIRALEDKSPELASRLRMRESRLSKSPAIRKTPSRQSENDIELTTDGTSSSWRKLTETLIEDARIDMEKERFVDAGRTYLEIAKRWDLRGFEWAMDAIDAILETWRDPEYHPGQEIYSQLFGAIIPSAVPVFLRWAEKHMEKKKYFSASVVYSNLVDNGYEEGERGEMLGFKFLAESREYEDAGKILLSILRSSDFRFVEPAALIAGQLLTSDHKNGTWVRICEKLLRQERLASSMRILSVAEKLLKNGKHAWARTIFRLVSEHEKNRSVLTEALAIAERNEETVGTAFTGLIAYGYLAETWMPLAVEKAFISAREYENGTAESYVPAWTIYLQIAQWSMDFRKIAIEGALRIWEKAMEIWDVSFGITVWRALVENFPEHLDERMSRFWLLAAEHLLNQRSGAGKARGIWSKIMELRPNESVGDLLAFSEKLEKKGRDLELLTLYSVLLKTRNPAVFERNAELASQFLKNWKEHWVGGIYCRLARFGKTEFLGKAVELAEEFVRNGEISMARSVFHDLQKLSHIDGGAGVSRLRKLMLQTASEEIENGDYPAAMKIYEAVKSPFGMA